MVTLSPVGVDTQVANMLTCLATYTEDVKEYFEGSSIVPQYSVVYSHGTPTLHGESVFIPITAVVTFLVPSGIRETTSKIFKETFMAVIQEQTVEPCTVTITSVGNTALNTNSIFTIYDSLEIFIA